MTNQHGFTLIEALVAGVISVMIPAIVISLIRISNAQLSGSSSRLRLSQISNLVSEDVQRSAVFASTVLIGNGSGSVGCTPGDPIQVGTNGVVFCSAAPSTIKAYQVIRPDESSPVGKLQERNAGDASWTDFRAGPDIVWVEWNPGPFNQKDPGLFGVGPGGKYVYFNFRYHMSIGGITDTLAMQTETVECRN